MTASRVRRTWALRRGPQHAHGDDLGSALRSGRRSGRSAGGRARRPPPPRPPATSRRAPPGSNQATGVEHDPLAPRVVTSNSTSTLPDGSSRRRGGPDSCPWSTATLVASIVSVVIPTSHLGPPARTFIQQGVVGDVDRSEGVSGVPRTRHARLSPPLASLCAPRRGPPARPRGAHGGPPSTPCRHAADRRSTPPVPPPRRRPDHPARRLPRPPISAAPRAASASARSIAALADRACSSASSATSFVARPAPARRLSDLPPAITVSPPSAPKPVGATSGRTRRPARTSRCRSGVGRRGFERRGDLGPMALADLSTGELDRRLGRLANLFLPSLMRGTNLLGAGTSGVRGTQLIAALDDLVDEVGALRGEQVDGPRRHRRLRQLGEVAGLLGLHRLPSTPGHRHLAA